MHGAGAEALAAAMQPGGEEAPLGVWGEAAGALGVVGAALVQGFDMLAGDSPDKGARAPFANSLGGSAPLARPFHKGPPGTARAPFGNLTNAQGGRLGRDPMEKSRALGAKTFKEFQRRKQERMAKAREGGGAGGGSPTPTPQPPATPPQDGGEEEGAEGPAWGVRMPLWGGMSLAVTVEQEEQMLHSRDPAEDGAGQPPVPTKSQEEPPSEGRQEKASALGVATPAAESRDAAGTQSWGSGAEDPGSWETIDLDRPFVSAPPPPVPAAAMTDFPTWGATGALPELPHQAPASDQRPAGGPGPAAAAEAPPTDGWDCEWTTFNETPQEQPPPPEQPPPLQLPAMGPLRAALVIQGCWRGHMARRFCQSLRDLAFREQQAAQAEMELREVAVSVLQKAWQRRAARAAAQKTVEALRLQRRLENEAAGTLQQAWRAYTAWRLALVLTEFQAREAAAVQIQRRVRGQMGRKTARLIRSERASQARAQARAQADAKAIAEAEARALAQAEAEARALAQAEAEARAWREERAAGAIQKLWKSHWALKKRREAARPVEVEPMKVSEAQEMRAELNALKKQIELLTQAISLNHSEAPMKKGRRSRSRSQGKKEEGEGHHRSRSLSAAPREEAANGPDARSEGKKGTGRRGRRSRSLPRYAPPAEGGGQAQAKTQSQLERPREREELLAAPPGLANPVLEALPKRYGGGRKNRHGGRRQPRS